MRWTHLKTSVVELLRHRKGDTSRTDRAPTVVHGSGPEDGRSIFNRIHERWFPRDQIDPAASQGCKHVVEVALAVNPPGKVRASLIDADDFKSVQSVHIRRMQLASHG